MEGSLLVDVSRLVHRTAAGRLPTGIDRVCLAYLAHFGHRAQAVLRWRSWRRILPWQASQDMFALLATPGADFRAAARRVIARACVPPWPSQDGRNRVYLHLGHAGLEDGGLRAWLQATRQRPVAMVHDLIPLTHPEYCRPGESLRHAGRLRSLLGSAAGLVANSQHTAGELASFARQQQLPLPALTVAPLAPATLPAGDAAPPLPQPYFVVLGTIEPRKNHLLLLHVWRELACKLGTAAPHLVVIGQRGWECENVVDLLERCEPLRGLVHELPSCTDLVLARWLRHARGLLFPSFAEGYGMPLVEALQAGTPVIASDLPVFREIAGTVPDYLHPLDGPGWLRAIRDYAGPVSLRRDAQVQRLGAFRCPTWAEHFHRVEGFLDSLR